jgi:hypothetical protein
MIDLKTYIYEGIFDEEDQLEDIDRNSEGLNDALKALKKGSKYFTQSCMGSVIRNLDPINKFGRVYREAKKKGFEEAEGVFVKTLMAVFADHDAKFVKYFHKIVYNHLEDMFEYHSTDHIAGFGPMLRKAPLHKFDKDDLDKRQFNNYKDAEALLAWASPLSPSENYMIKITKDMDKHETELMVELIKTVYKND